MSFPETWLCQLLDQVRHKDKSCIMYLCSSSIARKQEENYLSLRLSPRVTLAKLRFYSLASDTWHTFSHHKKVWILSYTWLSFRCKWTDTYRRWTSYIFQKIARLLFIARVWSTGISTGEGYISPSASAVSLLWTWPSPHPPDWHLTCPSTSVPEPHNSA